MSAPARSPSRSPRCSSGSASRQAGGQVAGVGPDAQDLYGLVQVAVLGQQIGQPPGGMQVTGVGRDVQQLPQLEAAPPGVRGHGGT